MKISEWIEQNISSHGVYSIEWVKKELKVNTGFDLKARGVLASVVNKTVGHFKGLLAPLPNPKERVIGGHELADELLTELEIKPTGNYHGRGSQFRSDLKDLKIYEGVNKG